MEPSSQTQRPEAETVSAINYYPTINVTLIQNPSKLYAFPVIGFLYKLVTIIPLGLVLLYYAVVLFTKTVSNAFYVMSNGKYKEDAYNYSLGYLRYITKTTFWFFGLTNKFPGFGLNIEDSFSVDMPMPQNPEKFYAYPIIGFLVRNIFLIPFLIVQSVLSNAVMFGATWFNSFYVLFTGKYSETIFELVRDCVRYSLAASAYGLGLSDKYPSFHISMNHKKRKIALIIVGVIMLFSNSSSNRSSHTTYNNSNSSNIYNSTK